MTRLLELVVYMTLLTWISIMLGAALRNREWTLDGMKVGLSNRDHLPEATPLGGRAERAAANTKENFILFAALALTAQLAGLGRAGNSRCGRLLLGASDLSAGVSARYHVSAQRHLGRRHRRARHDGAGAAVKPDACSDSCSRHEFGLCGCA